MLKTRCQNCPWSALKAKTLDACITNNITIQSVGLYIQPLKLCVTFVTKNKYIYYMATIARALWLAAERALFSCNDRALWKFFPARRLFWVVSKSYERVSENNKNYWQSRSVFSKLACKYFFSRYGERRRTRWNWAKQHEQSYHSRRRKFW